MKPVIATVLLLVCVASVPQSRADVPQEQHIDKKISENASLIGTWRLVSYKYGDMKEFQPLSKDLVQIKYIMGTHFAWVNYDAHSKKINRSAGGHYTIDGDTYTEAVEYGIGEDILPMIGKNQVLIAKVQGDKLTNSGTISIGVKIEEIWERVKE